jgi:hypothetical protein
MLLTPLVAARHSLHDHLLAVLQAEPDDCRVCDVPSCTLDTTCLPAQKRQTSSAAGILAAALHFGVISRTSGCLVADHLGHSWILQ